MIMLIVRVVIEIKINSYICIYENILTLALFVKYQFQVEKQDQNLDLFVQI